MKYFIGIVLIISAYVFSVYFIYSELIIYSIYIYSLGAIAILLSSKKITIKLLSIVAPLLLWFPIMWLLFQVSIYFDKTHQKIDLIVSDNFNGTVIIVNNVPCAKPLQKLKGREQIEIPISGVILVNENTEINEIWSNFYVKSSNGQKIKIYPSWASKSKKLKSRDVNTVEVHSFGNSGTSLMLEDSVYTFTTTTLYIGRTLTDEFYKLGYGTERKQNVSDSLLKNCLLGI